MKTIELNGEFELQIKQGYKLVKKENGKYAVEKIELSNEEKLENCKKLIEEYNTKNKLLYYTDSSGEVKSCKTVINWSNSTENKIKAEQLLMVWRRLADVFNERVILDWNSYEHMKYYLYYNKEKLNITCCSIAKDVNTYFKDEQTLQKAREEMGDDNLIFMFENL